jgi:hypothetical protein
MPSTCADVEVRQGRRDYETTLALSLKMREQKKESNIVGVFDIKGVLIKTDIFG